MISTHSHLLALACLSVGISLGLGCSEPGDEPPAVQQTDERAEGRTERVVLVTIDTLRNDRVGMEIRGHAVTPELDALAARGARFHNAISPIPITLPSHATILTGLDPPHHGVRANSTFALDPAIPTLATRMSEAGIPSGAFVGAVVLDSVHGLDQGFDIYDDRMAARHALGDSGYPERQANAVVDAALDWLTAEQPERFFLWVHVYDPHMAHNPPQYFSDLFRGDLYAAEINFSDQQIGRLIESIDRRYADGGTLFLVTSDHGESLGEHGDPTHSYTLYDATQKVPFIMAGPGVPENRAIDDVVRLADIAPTVLAAMELPPVSPSDGLDLRAYFDDEPDAPRTAWVETVATRFEQGWSPLYGVRTARFKYIRGPRPELYELETDPHELSDLVDLLPGVASDLDARVEAVLATARPVQMTVDPDPEERAKLIALGYVIPDHEMDLQAAVQVGGINPRDMVHDLTTLAEALDLFEKGKEEEAMDLLETIESTGSHVNVPRARVARSLGRLEESLAYAQQAVESMPGWSEPYIELANTLAELGRNAEAERAFERVTELDPNNPRPHLALGIRAMLAGDLDKASAHLERAIAGNALVEDAYWRLAAIRFGQGRAEEAEELLDALPPRARWTPVAVRNLAAGEVLAGDVKGARKRVRLALRRHPNADALRSYQAELAAYAQESGEGGSAE